jgi:tetratricopeptide (TPR) repeat protein
MTQAPRPISYLLRMLALAALVNICHAQTEDYSDITKLLKVGKANDALNKAEQRLVVTPRDPQLRFLRGVAQADSGKTLEAIASFTRLTEEYPELPEPYNNLAVLYANQNQLEKARIALEMAIRTNPSYSTAHENMGDIYAKLASQAYNKALQLDESSATTIKPKLALIRELFAPISGGRANTKPAVATTAPTPPVVVVAQSSSLPATTMAAAKNDTPPTKSIVSTADEAAVESSVNAWAKAWSDKNMSAYLASYSADFDPPGRQTKSEWAKERESRIVTKNKITVDLSDMTIKIDGSKATARFRQAYKGDSFVSNSRKTLDLVKSNGRWYISKESVGG